VNLLITNSHAAQAYAILRALRPYATRVVATMNGTTRWRALTSHAAYSRHIDARYYTPHPAVDWLAGVVQDTNTEHEEAYVRRIEEICRAERIDTIFPSSDAEVYVFAKNKARFARQGIVCVVQNYGSLTIPLDKYETNCAAKRAGFPAPDTIVPNSREDIQSFADRVPPPWLVKPRCTFGSIGTKVVRNRADLESTYEATARRQARPMIQEFIPGRIKENLYVVVDNDACIRSFMRTEVLKIRQRLVQDSVASFRISLDSALYVQAQALMRDIGTWGGFTCQTKIDARDGTPKLLEINPRLGMHTWFRTQSGVNEPLLLLRLARGESIDTVTTFPGGALVFEPIEDLLDLPFELLDLMLYRIRISVLGRQPIDRHNPPYSLAELAKSFATNYGTRGRKVIGIHTRHLLEDPAACGLWFYAYAGLLLRTIDSRGK
jgi:biotin carboxylase